MLAEAFPSSQCHANRKQKCVEAASYGMNAQQFLGMHGGVCNMCSYPLWLAPRLRELREEDWYCFRNHGVSVT